MQDDVLGPDGLIRERPMPGSDQGQMDLKRTAPSVVVIPGDGVGPEVTEAALKVLDAACPGLDWTYAEAGSIAFDKGIASGLPRDTLDVIADVGVVLKGPLATPIGYGEKSANVTLRKMFELYGNIRPVKELPGVRSAYAGRGIDLVVVRENVEDLYAGIEHMQTPDVAQCLKLITRKGSEKIARLAFAYAYAEGRSTIHCATKANIMKLTEGLFKSVFEEVARDWPALDSQHMLIDNCAHQMVVAPEQFDVIVTTNMNGDIISDLAAGLVGGLGLAPSANIGAEAAVFEAVHGSAPDIAGRNIANPTAMILSGVMMLRHLGYVTEAFRVEQALRLVYDAGTALTADVSQTGQSAGTDQFADEVIKALDGVSPMAATPDKEPFAPPSVVSEPTRSVERNLDGVDVFVEWRGKAKDLAQLLEARCDLGPFELAMISNRGCIMHPTAGAYTDPVDHWRCRFLCRTHGPDLEQWIGALLASIASTVRWMHVEKLVSFDGTPGYTRAQGEA